MEDDIGRISVNSFIMCITFKCSSSMYQGLITQTIHPATGVDYTPTSLGCNGREGEREGEGAVTQCVDRREGRKWSLRLPYVHT